MRRNGEIDYLADEVVDEANCAGIFPVPIVKIIKQLGFEVQGISGDDIPNQFSGQVNHEKKLVLINNRHSSVRKRFTLAHELGHIILHPNQDQIDYRLFGETSDKETEANRFAATILMPVEAFKKISDACAGDLTSIADYFGVSVAAAMIRDEYFDEY